MLKNQVMRDPRLAALSRRVAPMVGGDSEAAGLCAAGLVNALFRAVAEYAPSGHWPPARTATIRESIGATGWWSALLETGWVEAGRGGLFVRGWPGYAPNYVRAALSRRGESMFRESIERSIDATIDGSIDRVLERSNDTSIDRSIDPSIDRSIDRHQTGLKAENEAAPPPSPMVSPFITPFLSPSPTPQTQSSIPDFPEGSRRGFIIRKVIPLCPATDRRDLTEIVAGWDEGDWIWKEYERWRHGASAATRPSGYWAACIRNTEKNRGNE